MSYDRNGLELSAVAETLNSYRYTAVEVKRKKYVAYAQAARPKGDKQWAMFHIAEYDDPRDAAHVAQTFMTKYSKEEIRQMVTDETFNDVCEKFLAEIEIPTWQYPAEGLLIEDITNDYGYKRNYVNSASEALKEAIAIFKIKTPDLKTAKVLVNMVEMKYKEGMSYRDAAKVVMGV
jgi:hypothetical protein